MKTEQSFTMQDLEKLRSTLESREVNLDFHLINPKDKREMPDYMLETELMYEGY